MEYLLDVGTLTVDMSELVALVAALGFGGVWANQSGLPVLVFVDITNMIM